VAPDPVPETGDLVPFKKSTSRLADAAEQKDVAARALELAQRTADEAIAAARREAEEIVAQARREAVRIIDESTERLAGSF